MKKAIGHLMIFCIFAGMFGFVVFKDGLFVALGITAFVIVLLTWIVVATGLISE